MRIWHISDTHSMHGFLRVPNDIDMVIHSGDVSNPSNPYINEPEVHNFIEWYASLPMRYKIFVAGNHDTSIEKRLVTPYDFEKADITYLENSSTHVEGFNIWGTPITPAFGVGWAWNRVRSKMNSLWESIPEYTDIVISHGPPKGILDLTYNQQNEVELCGCIAMKKHMLRLQPQLCLFGHIHNFEDITNAGTMKIYGCNTLFSNGSCATDGKFMQLDYLHHGNIIEI